MKKILIAPNSFKGCADSITISNYFKEYLADLKEYKIIVKPISDGGDGFLDVCKSNFNLKELKYQVTTPYDESSLRCNAGYDENDETIYIESAKVLGLNLIPSGRKNPMLLSSKGVGDLLKKIAGDIKKKKIKADKVIIGIGGTGTNDLGLGAASRFGLKLIDAGGNECQVIPKNYKKIKLLDWKRIDLPFEIFCVIDVENPLTGENGASRTFARQKGASDNDIESLEEGFQKLVNIFIEEKLIKGAEMLPGAGGGLAAGLSVFLNAKIITAENFILNTLRIGKLKNEIDYLITGEGSFDPQSIMKKGAWILMRNFQDSAQKIFLCCGIIEERIKPELNPSVIPIELSKFFNNKKESINNIQKGIESAALEIRKILGHSL
ncbi:MAG TPA: glycerate kinase [Ignavibacteriaceae bacterium]|nr:glycerate kinase [Ignavibacteriaceae bacterium]